MKQAIQRALAVITAFLKRVAGVLAAVNTVILLTIFFVFVIAPVGVLFRSFRRTVLSTPAERDSLWTARGAETDARKPF